jgi:hypothetical protein
VNEERQGGKRADQRGLGDDPEPSDPLVGQGPSTVSRPAGISILGDASLATVPRMRRVGGRTLARRTVSPAVDRRGRDRTSAPVGGNRRFGDLQLVRPSTPRG